VRYQVEAVKNKLTKKLFGLRWRQTNRRLDIANAKKVPKTFAVYRDNNVNSDSRVADFGRIRLCSQAALSGLSSAFCTCATLADNRADI
jgi:hypothetical protein